MSSASFLNCSHFLFLPCSDTCHTCEAAGLGQQKGAPGHEEEESRLQEWEAVQLGELGDVEVELKNNSWIFEKHDYPEKSIGKLLLYLFVLT